MFRLHNQLKWKTKRKGVWFFAREAVESYRRRRHLGLDKRDILVFENMKTLLVTQDFPPQGGGMQEYYLNICLNLPPEEVIVAVPKVEGCQEADRKLPFKIYRAPFAVRKAKVFIYSLIWLLQLIWIIKKERISTVQCGVILPIGYLSLILKWITKIKYLIYFHGMDALGARAKIERSRFKKRLLYKIISRSSKLIFNSKYTMKILEGLEIQKDKCEVIYPGVELRFFRRRQPSPEIVKKYNLENKRVILFVGRLVKRKGIDNVLQALPEVIEEVPNLRYLIVGKGDDETRLRKIVEDMGLEKFVEFLGYAPREDLPHLYNASDIFVMISREIESRRSIEGFGIVYLEANACGVPVIGGRSGGIPEAILNGETGLLVEPENIEEISQAMLRILKDKPFARKLGERGRQRVEAEFSWDRAGKRVHLVLEKL